MSKAPMLRPFHGLLTSALALGILLVGCSTGGQRARKPDINAAALRASPEARIAKLRSTGAKETTLAAFCKSPPTTQNPVGAAMIKSTCQPAFLKVASDAAVFDKGNGAYVVVLKRPVECGKLQGGGRPKVSGCAGLLPGEKMTAMAFVAR